MRRLWLSLLLLATSTPSFSQTVSTEIQEQMQIKLAEAERRADLSERDQLIREIADRLEDAQTAQAYNRFEIWTGALVGFFSVLITILVVIFGFRTERAAARAATDAAKAELDAARQSIDESVLLARASCEQAEMSLQKIRALEGEAAKGSSLIIERLKLTEKTSETSITVAEFTPNDEESISKDGDITTTDDIKNKIYDFYREERWKDALEHSIALKALSIDLIDQIEALQHQATALDNLTDRPAEAEVYREILMLSEKISDPSIRGRYISRNLLNLAITAGQLDDSDLELDLYNQVRFRFFESDDSVIQEHVARSLFNRYVVLSQRKSDESLLIEAGEEVIHRFNAHLDDEVQGLIASMLNNVGADLHNQEKYAEALPNFDRVLRDFEGRADVRSQRALCLALSNKGRCLEAMGRHDEALKVYRSLIRRFGRSDDPQDARQVTRAKRVVRQLSRSKEEKSAKEPQARDESDESEK